jgi:hypothetical protein
MPQGMNIFAKLWTTIKNWIKSLDEEWDEITAENGRNCKDVET